MNINISKENLLDSLIKVGKGITGKSTNMALSGVYIIAEGKNIIFRGTDIDISIETSVEAEVLIGGSLLVDYKMLLEIVRKLPNDLVSIDSEEGEEVTINCKKSNFKILTMDYKEYPNFPKLKDENTTSILVNQSILKELISSVSYAASQDDTRPILKGILIELIGNKLNLVALDGYRLAISSNIITSSSKDTSAVIDCKHFIEISKLLNQKGAVEIGITSNNILFKVDETTIICRLLEGKFINYNSLISNENKFKFDIDRLAFLSALDRAILVNKGDGQNLIKLTIDKNGEKLNISSRSQVGNSSEEINISNVEGLSEEFKIGFNSKYLLDILKNNYNDEICMSGISELQPCIIRGKDISKDIETHLVLPVRIVL
ncbi:MAG: DNA polymerase III subunit beta [Clostridium celatum]|uniref:DNA polymerase III subunit beta n=1 Tax=Clostridium tertium TaxID=1559 RepID=UPI0029013FBA|nr:DNA polymerase III subunit beta [Clostridium celatum]